MNTNTPTENPPARRKPRLLRRALRAMIALVPLLLIGIGPWPAENSTYVGSQYEASTLARLNAMTIKPASATPLRLGVAEVDITPPVGHQLAGYSYQPTKACQSIHESVFARALSVEASGRLITILTADLLLIHPDVANAIIQRTGLKPDEIYFTASHTHCGPGQWARPWFEQFSIGRYDEVYFNHLVDQLASAVTQSRATLEPASMGVAFVHAPSFMRSRIDGVKEMDDRLVACVFRQTLGSAQAPPRAILVFYAAHPTAAGREDLRISPEYPGGLVDHLRELTGAAHVLFACSAVGDSAPLPPHGPVGCDSAHDMGVALADLLAPALADVHFRNNVELTSVRLPVDLPTMRVPISEHLQASSVATCWFNQKQTHMSVLRLGPIVLAGMPCDYAGGAARPFIDWAAAHDLVAVTTSFNGDYMGYFMSHNEFVTCQRMEQMATFMRGPWAGAYFADLAQRITARTIATAPQ